MSAALGAGRELDAEVAEKVMGATGRRVVYEWSDRKRREFPLIAFDHSRGFPAPLDYSYRTFVNEAGEKEVRGVAFAREHSTDIAAAWLVVERMRRDVGDVHLYSTHDGFAVHIHEDGTEKVWRASVDPRDGGMELAICLAALKAVEQLRSAESATPKKEPA